MNKVIATKLRIIDAGEKAVEQLIKVAKEVIVTHDETDILTDGTSKTTVFDAAAMKNAVATKKMAIFDAFEILSRIETEREDIENMQSGGYKSTSKQGFAERRSK